MLHRCPADFKQLLFFNSTDINDLLLTFRKEDNQETKYPTA